jgi:hypothetical protein
LEGASIAITATGFMSTKINHVRRRPGFEWAALRLPRQRPAPRLVKNRRISMGGVWSLKDLIV